MRSLRSQVIPAVHYAYLAMSFTSWLMGNPPAPRNVYRDILAFFLFVNRKLAIVYRVLRYHTHFFLNVAGYYLDKSLFQDLTPARCWRIILGQSTRQLGA